jgi:hypothetical protein
MLRNHRKCGRNRAFTKGTLLLRQKQFLVCTSPATTTGWRKTTRGAPSTCSTTKVSFVETGLLQWTFYTCRRKSFSSLTRLTLEVCDCHTRRGSPLTCFEIIVSLIAIGQKQRVLYSWGLWENPPKVKTALSAQYSGGRPPHLCKKLFLPGIRRRAAQPWPGLKGDISSKNRVFQHSGSSV